MKFVISVIGVCLVAVAAMTGFVFLACTGHPVLAVLLLLLAPLKINIKGEGDTDEQN